MMVRQLSAVVVLLVGTLFVSSAARAERVGYSFSGRLNPQPGPVRTWFGEPLNASFPLTGTFSYDTDGPGILSSDGQSRGYAQLISGGYSLDVDFGTKHVVVQASDYMVSVVNNADADDNPDTPPVDEFVVNYMSLAAANIQPAKLRVDGADWSGDAIVILALFWDQSAFEGPDEPKLTADRPGITPDSIIANANSTFAGGGPPKITIDQNLFTRIVPQPGDYNVDGKVDGWDYLEWRRAFGTTNSCCDGNHDGIVDAGDYIILEHAEAMSGQSVVSQVSSVPEPACTALAFVACFGLTGVRRKRLLCRNIV